MNLDYPGKLDQNQILTDTHRASYGNLDADFSYLINDDNLFAMRGLIDAGFSGNIDLVYIDPPFATNNAFYSGNRTNSISSSNVDSVAYEDYLTGHEFIEFIRQRLVLIKELLSDKGSIYLHIDYKIGHYIKMVMDEVFGIENFRNDITRIKCNPKNFKRKSYGNIKDLILFYSKSDKLIWNDPTESQTEDDLNRLFKKTSKEGRKYTTIPLHAPGETKNGKTGGLWRGMLPPPGRHWRCAPNELDSLEAQGLVEWSSTGVPRRIIFADEKGEKKKQDIWDYKDSQNPIYPTEKNMDMLMDIIKASSSEDSYVMDCFCGSGSTLKAARNLGRKFIGIDQSEIAIKTSKNRLKEEPDELFALDSKIMYIN